MKISHTFKNFTPKLIPKSELQNAELNSAIACAKYESGFDYDLAKETL